MTTPNNTTLINGIYSNNAGIANTNPFVTVYSLRDPNSSDINWPIQKRWINFSGPREWILESYIYNSPIASVVANWVLLSNAPILQVETLTGDDGVVVNPNAFGNITTIGNVVANSTFSKALYTNSPLANTEQWNVQLSTAIASTDPTLVSVGLSVFNSADFTVDANGFVSLSGSGTASIQKITGNDTLTVIPTSGNVNLLGAVVANGTDSAAIWVKKTATSTETIDVQLAAANGSSVITKAGLASFSNAQFSVDANGFVTLVGGSGGAITGLIPDAHTAPGTTPVTPASGNITLEGGATFATGTRANPIRTNSLAANTIDFQIQLAGSNAGSSTANNFGVAQFDSNQFTVTSGFVQISNYSPFAYTQINHASSPYTVLTTDEYISADPSSGTISILLPNSPTLYRQFVIKDRTGNASTNHISVTTVGGAVTIDGQTTYTMSSNFTAIQLLWNGTSYEVY
jgi:hypothetical protein